MTRAPAWSTTRLLTILSALALAFALLPMAGASAQEAGETERLDADTNIGAAIEWSQHHFEASAIAALGRSDVFADNLASGVIQGVTNSPLLLTPSTVLDQRVTNELERLGVSQVHILGGFDAISQAVEQQLQDEGYTTVRHRGETRIETAIDIAGNTAPAATTALLSRAFGSEGGDETQAWADALAGGAWAADASVPVLFTQREVLTGSTRDYIEQSSIERIIILGGTDAILPTVEAELVARGIDVERIAGNNRFHTAVLIAQARGYEHAGDTGDAISLVEGQEADAWASGFAAAAFSQNAPLVLANRDAIPPETRDWLEGGEPTNTTLVCGPFVMQSACVEAAAAVGTAPPPGVEPRATTLSLAPQQATNVFPGTHTVTATVTDQQGEPFQPEDGQTIRFEVYRDTAPDAQAPVAVVDEPTTNGQATLSYSYQGGTGESTDTIIACLIVEGDTPPGPGDLSPFCAEAEEVPGDGVVPRDDRPADSATKHWVSQNLTLALTPQQATLTTGETHTVTAQVRTADGNAVPDDERTVRFEVYRDAADGEGYVPVVAQSQTTVNGDATLTYTSATAGQDVIVACLAFPSDPQVGANAAETEPVCAEFTTDADGTVTAVEATDERPADDATATWEAVTS